MLGASRLQKRCIVAKSVTQRNGCIPPTHRDRLPFNLRFYPMKVSHFFHILFCCLSFFGGSFAALAQPRATNTTIDLGKLAWRVNKSITLDLSNRSNKSFRIVKVETDCNCTQAQWSHTDLAPNESQQIVINFDAQTLGHFQRQVRIHTSDRQVVCYALKGQVVKETEIAQHLPIRMGDLSVSTKELTFDNIRQGNSPQQILYVRNNGQKAYMPLLMLLPKYLTSYAVPELLRPGQTGKIFLTLHSAALDNYGLTESHIYLSKERGEKVGPHNEIRISTTLLPQQTIAPQQLQAQLNVDSLIHLGKFAKKSKLRGQLLITNTGKSTLHIHRVQVQHPSITVSISKSSLEPGEKATLKITLQRTENSHSNKQEILLISNDPQQPKRIIQLLSE